MARYRNSRIVPIILIVLVSVIAIAALVSLARAVFFSGTPQTSEQVDVSREALLATDLDRRVTMTVRGPIVADEAFQSYRITVTPSARSLITYNGYLDRVVDEVRFANNTPAYEQFVFALDRAELARGEAFTDDRNDVRGICATGRVVEFAIINKEDVVKQLWTSTCRGSAGSLDASVDQLTNLFVSQIPSGRTTINKINL